MFWDSKEKKMKPDANQETEKVIEEVTKPALIPFLERRRPITDLESLMERVTDLTTQIRRSNENISELEYKIEKLEKGISYIHMDNKGGLSISVSPSDHPEIVENFRLSLITSCKGKIVREKNLIHTCQDELEWLETKIGTGPHLGRNRFELGSFNFNPMEDHC